MHNSKRGAYPDVPPLYLEDGTWVLKYSSQSALVENWRDQDYNQKMINCMECGVPVGVFFATSVGYKVLGLAFVERYEPENSWFVLHGPVHKWIRRSFLPRYELYEGRSGRGGVYRRSGER